MPTAVETVIAQVQLPLRAADELPFDRADCLHTWGAAWEEGQVEYVSSASCSFAYFLSIAAHNVAANLR